MKPVTETELKAAAVAPRVTQEDLDANIVAVNYLNVGEALRAVGNAPVHRSHYLLTQCVIVLKNGFTVTGESACASPENFDQEIGNRLAYSQAVGKIWPLMGYSLREQLAVREAMLTSMAFEPAAGTTTYLGTKLVNARPMSRLDYNELRGWLLPADENGADEGYLVEYTDRLDGQVDGFKGYVSWSPKEVFEHSYRPVQTQPTTQLKIKPWLDGDDRRNGVCSTCSSNPHAFGCPKAGA